MGLFDFFGKKHQQDENLPENQVNNEPQMLFAQLFFKQEPVLDNEAILTALKKRFNQVDTPKEEGNNTLLYFFPEYTVNLKEGSIPAQCTILYFDKKATNIEKLESALQQAWHWPEARQVLGECKYELHISDFMSRLLPYKVRVEYYQKFVVALIDATKPDALYFRQSQKVVAPLDYREAISGNRLQILDSLLNIRFYNVSNGNTGEMLMDTVGLHALGLPDFQLRFQEADPNQAATLLINYAYYIFENGPVIKEGNTIQGFDSSQKLTCHYEDSLLEPNRIVISLEGIN